MKFSINSAAFVDDNWNSNVAGPVTETGLNTGDTVVAEVLQKTRTEMDLLQHRIPWLLLELLVL